jgi:AmmeMemoRadiSam system protein B
MRPRPPAMAGTFYPADSGVLRAQLAALLDANRKQGGVPRALIVPHAGYIYSGPVAAAAYSLLEGGRFERVLLIGPAHRAAFAGLALPDADAFATPLGEISIAAEACAALLKLPQVRKLDRAHTHEHSLEVQLPFLQTVLPEFELVPLLVGEADAQQVAEVIEQVWDARTLPVISSDLSHYLNYKQAQVADAATNAAILLGECDLTPEQACGCRAINGLLLAMQRRKLHISLIDFRNSGDTAGSKDQVVGYAAYAIN